MAGAFDDFTPPQPAQQGGGAFSGFAPPSDQPEGWSDYLLRHLANAGSAADAGVRSFDRAITLGMFDPLLSQATGQNETAITKQAAAAHPYASTAGEVGGYLAGPGKIGITGKLGGGLLGMGAEGALTSGATAVGDQASGDQSADPLTSTLTGGATGVAGAVAGKMLNPIVRSVMNSGPGQAVAQRLGYGALKTPQQVTDALGSQEKQDWQATRGFTVDNADVRQAAVQGQQDIDNQATQNPRVKILGQNAYKKLGQLGEEALGNQPVTAERLNDYVNDLHVTNTGDQSPQAGLLAQNRVNQLLSGPAQDAIDTAKRTSQQFRDAQALQTMGEKLDNFGTSPSNAAKGIAQRWYDPGDPQFEALKDISGSGEGYQSAYGLAHAAHYPIMVGLGALGLGGHLGAAIAGGLTYTAAKPAIGKALQAATAASQRAAIARNYPALTGYQTSHQPDLTANAALRALLFGPTAAAQ
jgi:hypothetical protein